MKMNFCVKTLFNIFVRSKVYNKGIKRGNYHFVCATARHGKETLDTGPITKRGSNRQVLQRNMEKILCNLHINYAVLIPV